MEDLLGVFCEKGEIDFQILECDDTHNSKIPKQLLRDTPYLTHPVFNSYHSETEMLRYISTSGKRYFTHKIYDPSRFMYNEA